MTINLCIYKKCVNNNLKAVTNIKKAEPRTSSALKLLSEQSINLIV